MPKSLAPGPPPGFRAILRGRFHVSDSEVDRYRYFEAGSKHEGTVRKRFRLVDTGLVPNWTDRVRSYEDAGHHDTALVFEGFLNEDGKIHLEDKRIRPL